MANKHPRSAAAWLLATLLVFVLAACGGGSDEGPREVGKAGGTVLGPDGASVTVPAGAATGALTIAIAKDGSAVPAEPPGPTFAIVSNVYNITPHGAAFDAPVTVTLPYDTALAGAGDALVMLKAQPFGRWVVHAEVQRTAGRVSIPVRDFSVFVVAKLLTPTAALSLVKPFTFDVSVTANGPLLAVTYSFKGQRPACTGGDRIETVFLNFNTFTVYDEPTHPVGGKVSTGLAEMFAVTGPALPAPGIGLTPVVHTVLQPPMGGSVVTSVFPNSFTPMTEISSTPKLKGRYICNGETTLAGTPSSATWVQDSASLPTLGWHSPVVALFEDIAAIATPADLPVPVSARVQTTKTTQNLLSKSRWEVSANGGTTWGPLAPTSVTAVPDTTLSDAAVATASGAWRVQATLPPFDSGDSGKLVRFSACVEHASGYHYVWETTVVCAAGQPRTVTIVPTLIVPSFSTAPTSQTVVAGDGASFSGVATGLPAPTLQWQRRNSAGDWIDIAGAQAGSLSLTSTTLADNGALFRLVASNNAGSTASTPVALTVVGSATAPAITAVSGNLQVAPGATAVFAATVVGTAPLSYQWQRDGVAITGANAPILRLDQVAATQAGAYTLTVTNAAGSTTSVASTLSLSAAAGGFVPPVIAAPPTSLTVGAGQSASFAVAVTGSGPFSYQWTKGGAPIAGATQAAYTLDSTALTDGGSYAVIVSSGGSSVTSPSATLKVDPATAAVAPSISTQPAAAVVLPGGQATLAVAASGSAPLSYEWRRNGSVVAGATGPVLQLNGLTLTEAGAYSVRVANGSGEVTSASAEIVVLGAPLLQLQPAAQSAFAGNAAAFTVVASGNQLRYQWLRDGVGIPGATAATYQTPVLALGDSGAVFSVLVYNGAGIVFSHSVPLTVTAAPVVNAGGAIGKLATGYTHVCAVTNDLKAACWGDNGAGQIGNGGTGIAIDPYVWTLPEPVRSVAAGYIMSCALTATTGRVFCSGSGVGRTTPGELAGFTGVRQIVAGQAHGCLLANDHSVWCWGSNNQNQLGDGTGAGSFVPVQVRTSADDPLGYGGVASLSAGHFHTCALRLDSTVACWGAPGNARLGFAPGTQTGLFPVVIPNLGDVVEVASGAAHNCVRQSLGPVLCWGDNSNAALGLGTVSPVAQPVVEPTEVLGLIGVAQLSAGTTHSCALMNDGTTRCWGNAAMGNGEVPGIQAEPVAVNGLSNGTTVGAGGGFTCVLRNNGELRCWGENAYRQLGTGNATLQKLHVRAFETAFLWQPQ